MDGRDRVKIGVGVGRDADLQNRDCQQNYVSSFVFLIESPRVGHLTYAILDVA